jgi:cytidylate kinase
VAGIIAGKLGFLLVNRDTITEGLADLGLPPQLTLFEQPARKGDEQEKKRRFYLTALHDFIFNLSEKNSLVVLGRGSQFLFRGRPDAFHIRLQAPMEYRVGWAQDVLQLSQKAAARLIRDRDRAKKRYIREVFNHSWTDMELYDLVLNTARLTPQGAAKVALQAFSLSKNAVAAPTEAGRDTAAEAPAEAPAKFMHPSEAEFVRVLDYYKISWQYEPHTFPLSHDSEGRISEAFTPDFYLPDFDMYVELTTQRQKLVWKKNKKIRQLQELYPDINIRVVYGRDYHSLLKKFGLDRD